MSGGTLSGRQQAIVCMWFLEATNGELVTAWAEEAYSFRELVSAVHRAEIHEMWPERNQELNGLVAL